jgi:uncharacterized RDD family membrane protein YckC
MAEVAAGPLYATFARRVRALVLDGVVLLGLLVALIFVAAAVHFGQTGRIVLFAIVIGLAILYEPILVSFQGRTIGQRLCNLRVVAPTADGRLPLWKAFVRWLLKALTGLASFATMGATRRNQALHDLPFGTTVEIAEPSKARAYEFIQERQLVIGGTLPARWRRAAVLLAYLGLLFMVLIFALPIVATPECLDARRCGSGEQLLVKVTATAWLAASIAVCIFDWQGRLRGARRQVPTEAPRPPDPGAAA